MWMMMLLLLLLLVVLLRLPLGVLLLLLVVLLHLLLGAAANCCCYLLLLLRHASAVGASCIRAKRGRKEPPCCGIWPKSPKKAGRINISLAEKPGHGIFGWNFPTLFVV